MNKTIVISIAGGSGSGKSTVANKIIENFKKEDITVIRLDDYYKAHDDLTYDQRKLVNYDHPDALDFDLLISHLNSLVSGNPIDKPIYDFTTHNRRIDRERIEPPKILLIEGILVLEDERLRKLSNIKIYVDTDSDIRFIRRMRRDIIERGRSLDDIVNQYLTTVKPMHEAFVERTKKYADIIIPNEFDHNVAVDLLISKIRRILND